jgi:hypothetical protein
MRTTEPRPSERKKERKVNEDHRTKAERPTRGQPPGACSRATGLEQAPFACLAAAPPAQKWPKKVALSAASVKRGPSSARLAASSACDGGSGWKSAGAGP